MRSITFLSRLNEGRQRPGDHRSGPGHRPARLHFGGFGFFFLGDALSDFFAGSGDNIGDAPDPFGTNLPNGTYACDPATGTCGAT